MPVFDGIKQATIKGDGKIIPDLVKGALHEGIKPDDLINYGFIAAMEIVGRDFAEAKIFIPEMLIAANAMKIGLTILKPHLADGRMKTIGKVVMGTVHGDLHDI